MTYKKKLTVLLPLLVFLTFIISFSGNTKETKVDKILQFSVQENLGTQEVPKINVKVMVQKTRELYVSVQDLNNNNKRVTSTKKRIKKSGNYHFDIDIKLKPGKYRFNAYLAPRGKGWNERIGNQLNAEMIVVNAPTYVKATEFSTNDKIKEIVWPKKITDNKEHTLTVNYNITEPRTLLVKLYNKKGWKVEGELKFPLKEPGQTSVPINNMLKSFGTGDFAWTAIISDKIGSAEINKKGNHFTIEDGQK